MGAGMAEDLVGKVFSFFSGDDPADDKYNMLKQVIKDLQQNKFSKYYRIKTEEIDPSFSAFLFSVYKLTYPVKVFMQDEKKMNRLRQIIIESFMDIAALETVKRLDTSAIEARARSVAPMELAAQIQTDIDKLVSQFDENRRHAVDRCYSMVAALGQLVNFNYFGLFRRIDTHFIEASFGVEPKFPAVKAVLFVKELGEFLSISAPMKPEDDWKNLLNLLKICDGQEVVNPDHFITLIKHLREMHTNKILELMIQCTIRNPVWHWKPKIPDEKIGDTWLEEKCAEAGSYIDQINGAQKRSQINTLIGEIFEASDLVRLHNYTVQQGEIFRKKQLDYFIYAEGINYLKAFLEDYLYREIKELCDILLIRGQWTNNAMSKEMSEALHQLTEISVPIAALDEALAEDGADGSRLRAAVIRVDRDKTQARYINSIIGNNNNDALELINLAAQEFITIGKHLKSLIEDVQKKHPELLINWRELGLVSKEPIPQRMVNNYKKINYFIQLLRLCTQ